MELAKCHPNRKVKNQTLGLCGSCYEKYLKERNPEYAERQRTNYQKWKKENPDKWYASNEKQKARRRELSRTSPEFRRQRRARLLKRKYNLTLEEYDKILESQNGGCAICGRLPGEKNLHIDHDHVTGKVRGILCHQCNWYIGTIESDFSIIDKIINYLGKSSEEPF